MHPSQPTSVPRPSAPSLLRPGLRSTFLAALLVHTGGFTAVHAQVSVDARITPVAGASRYEITIGNAGPHELALVSLLDAPAGDPRLEATLIAPDGFLASYDSGLGIVDFLGNTSGFGAGTSVAGFGFESLFGPGAHFTSFSALDIFGTPYAGVIRIVPNAVPEPGTALAGIGVAGALLWHRQRRNRTRP